MHIKIKNADIKLVLEVWLIIVFNIIVFPIFVNVDALYCGDNKKLYFNFKMFGFVKILSGYIELIDIGLAVHLSKTKAIILEFKKLLGVGKSFKPILDLHVLKIDVLFENSGKNAKEEVLFINSIFALMSCQLKQWLSYHKPYLKYHFRISFEDKLYNNAYLKTLIVFNIFIIILTFLKFIGEKIFYGFRAK